MKKALFIILALGIIVFSVAVFWFQGSTREEPMPASNDIAAEATPTFSWHFAEADSTNLDGLRQTDIFLAATLGARKEERLIDTVDGDCSELEGVKYEGDVSTTGNVQCYAAGLGQRYRITYNGRAYLVERKIFEEALPDVSPQDYPWEVVEEFSLK